MGTVKLIVGILAFVAVIVLGVQVIPPYWSNYQFEDFVKTEALISTQGTKTEEDIRTTVYKRAQELDIPVERDDIKVHRVGQQGTGSVTISVPYAVHVTLPGYGFDLHFDVSTTNKGLY